MIFTYFGLRWKNYDPAKLSEIFAVRTEFELTYTSHTLEEMNDVYYGEYTMEGGQLIQVVNSGQAALDVYVASEITALDLDAVEARIRKDFPDCTIWQKHEITVEEFKNSLERGSNCISAHRRIFSRCRIDYRTSSFFDPMPFTLEQTVLPVPKVKRSECMAKAARILGSKSLREELARIYSSKNKKGYYGHPVHYLISAGDWGAARDIYELLVYALQYNGRLRSNRITTFRNIQKGAYRDERYRQLLYAAEGGITVIELGNDSSLGRFASDFHEFTKHTAKYMEEMKKDTLFIFVEIMGKSVKDTDAISSILSKATVIQVTEGSGTPEQAGDYLLELVGKADFEVDDPAEALEFLPKEDSYSVTDIFTAYNSWYGNGLKNHIYKAYRQEKEYRIEVTEAKSDPYLKLRSLVGLKDAKAVIDQIVAAGKVQKVRERMGLKADSASRNMLFAGNPGTAKTTVARLIAEILKEEDVVKSGKLVECGRQDLVGKYVGWTAKIVEDKFREADGGVLFIDEAYSLVEDGRTYGAEAINTITQLMENYRERVIVIFAGYPDKMREFLAQNEGLRSRIAFHLNFPDYTVEELMEILELHAGEREYRIAEEARQNILDIFSEAVGQENYGNGRYVRNFLEQAIIRQSGRILRDHANDDLTKEEMCLLLAEDFRPVNLEVSVKEETRIGFSA